MDRGGEAPVGVAIVDIGALLHQLLNPLLLTLIRSRPEIDRSLVLPISPLLGRGRVLGWIRRGLGEAEDVRLGVDVVVPHNLVRVLPGLVPHGEGLWKLRHVGVDLLFCDQPGLKQLRKLSLPPKPFLVHLEGVHAVDPVGRDRLAGAAREVQCSVHRMSVVRRVPAQLAAEGALDVPERPPHRHADVGANLPGKTLLDARSHILISVLQRMVGKALLRFLQKGIEVLGLHLLIHGIGRLVEPADSVFDNVFDALSADRRDHVPRVDLVVPRGQHGRHVRNHAYEVWCAAREVESYSHVVVPCYVISQE
mmetsp:Transcript_16090/g.38763  ORF Transcript_16090/g.38763 Transcript_16090/m.38763 type:complete len:309 (-) Transcript_16090:1262-2188(-)